MHCQQRSDPVEPGSVANRRGHRNDRLRRQPTDHAGERTFHTGHHDNRIGLGDDIEVGEQPM